MKENRLKWFRQTERGSIEKGLREEWEMQIIGQRKKPF